MANYITIPDIVDSEPLVSFAPHADGITFDVVIDVGNTLTHLIQINADGREIPLVVLATDGGFLALDNVYVSSVSVSGTQSIANVTFAAQAVRFV